MNHLGRHVLVECYDASFEKLNNLPLIRQAMLRAAVEMGATVISDSFHKFSPQGVSGAVVIAESHLTIHTWPELGYAAIDFFTCGAADPNQGLQVLARQLGSATLKTSEFGRGFVRPTGGGDGPELMNSKTYQLGQTPAPAMPAPARVSETELVEAMVA